MRITFFFFLLLFSVASCSPKTAKELSIPPPVKKELPTPAPEEPPLFPPPPAQPEPETLADDMQLVARLEKSSCFGKCPVYELKVYDDGRVTFYGKAFADKIGKYQAVARKELIVDLMIKAEEIGYFNLKNQYPDEGKPTMYEFPVTITYLKMEGQEKIIQNRHDGPVTLKQFERLFENLFLKLNWEPSKL